MKRRSFLQIITGLAAGIPISLKAKPEGKISGFPPPPPGAGKPITGPVQIYESAWIEEVIIRGRA